MDKYKEAIERLKQWDREHPNGGYSMQERDEFIFPELKESEDERIRKALKEYFINSFQINGVAAICGVHIKDILAWLEKQGDYNRLIEEIKKCKEIFSKEKEKAISTNDKLSLGGRIAILEELLAFTKEKQGEQKPWSEEDEEHVNSLLKRLEGLCRNEFATTRFAINEDEDWLKSLKDRVQSQPKQEWSEEDSSTLKVIETAISNFATNENNRYELVHWLNVHCNAYPIPEKLLPRYPSFEESQGEAHLFQDIALNG